MNFFITLLLLASISLTANSLSTEDCDDCKVDLSTSRVKKDISDNKVEVLLSDTLKKVRQYKSIKDEEVDKLNKKLDRLLKEFDAYKVIKERETTKIRAKLTRTEHKLFQMEKRLAEAQYKIENSVIASSNWVEIEVEGGIDIHELALKYYGVDAKYQQIYVANSAVIGDDLSIQDGMSLRIPITEDFQDQPMFLNTN